MSDQKKFRILIVDDNPSIHDDFRKILNPPKDDLDLAALEEGLFGEVASSVGENFPENVIESAYQGDEGVDKVILAAERGDPFSMAFVDMRMPPGMDGIETIEKMWNSDPDLQVVICTAYSDYSWSETIARLGWTDKLLILKKPFDRIEVCQLALALSVKSQLESIAKLKAEQLQAMVTRRTSELQAEIERRQKVESLLLAEQSKLEIQANMDGLTNLLNRRAITERIVGLAAQAKYLKTPFSVLFIDVDHFKSVNDTYGHSAGDEVLRVVAERFKKALRPTDTIGRYGGEEFVVGLANCDKAMAVLIGDRLNQSIANEPIPFEGSDLEITVSVGVATDALLEGDANASQLLDFADQALYQAKKNGRNRVEQFTTAGS